ncbi:RecQ family ATP-dependent DNA helicase [candidate division CSSED10-310 bacterium]|uniref:ATP-dependent DNA helicase RecQ n=1 Tax=candidate division CSSED10-310 bacterium TaxID=2855610 RepID=A0ABV6YSA0_UNCC1
MNNQAQVNITLPVFSYSKISVYLECPKRYHYQYIEKIPTAPKPYFSFGTSLHNTLHEFHLADYCRSFEEVQELYRQQWIKDIGYTSPREEQEYFELGLQILQDYLQIQKKKYDRPLYLEQRFKLEFENFSLTGAIDRIDQRDNDVIEIIDYKTSKRMSTRDYIKKDLQLAIYGLAADTIIGKYPDILSFYFLRFNKKSSLQTDAPFYERTRQRLVETIDKILQAHELSSFPARPNNLCPYCDYYSQCSEGNRSTPRRKYVVKPSPEPRESLPNFEEQSKLIVERAGEALINTQLEMLKTHFNFDYFRPGQLEVILSVLLDNEVLAVMPTGSGKSLCYQMLSLQMPQVTVVISPLIALMKDQVESIRELGFRQATFLNTSLRLEQYRQRISNILKGVSRLVYLAPEALRNRNIVRVLEQVGVSLLVIDEAHCISQWGHDFRPDYLALKSLLNRWPECKILALTATATPAVQADIRAQLGSQQQKTIITGIDRPNLFLEVHHVLSDQDKKSLLFELLEELQGTGIIYVNTRKHAEKLTQTIQEWGIGCDFYHGGMDRVRRSAVQDAFMSDRLSLVVATNAFGMGIDKPDIRFIIHYHLPGTLEAYYQEIGRAGRDGAQSRTILFYADSDRGLQQFFIEDSKLAHVKLLELMHVMKEFQFENYLLIPLGILEKRTGLNETQVRVALSQMEKENVLRRLPDLSLELVISLNPFGDVQLLEEKDHEFYDELVHTLIPLIDEGMRVKLKQLSKLMKLPPDALEEALLTLKFFNVINLKPVEKGIALRLDDQRSEKSVSAITAGLQKIAEEKSGKLNSLIQYALTPICRRYILKSYFGEVEIQDKCGFCENCRGQAHKIELYHQAEEGTLPLRPVLETINTLRFAVGRNRLAEILAGSQKKDLIDKNFHLVPGYGNLNTYALKKVRSLINASVRAGYTEIFFRPEDTLRRYPLLRLTADGESLFNSAEPLFLKIEVDKLPPRTKAKKAKVQRKKQVTTSKPATLKRKKKRESKQEEPKELTGNDQKLFEALKNWRWETATKLRTKAYLIFSNETLQLIAQKRPLDFDELLDIKGVGSVKLADYGQHILKLVSSFQTDDYDQNRSAI